MTHKTKVLLGLMALGAIFSVFVFVKSANLQLPALKNLKSSALSIIDKDWDNDGLDNSDESYWNTDPNNPDTDGDGFLDGEEVASGHDPLIPGPDDFLPTNENLTRKMSYLTLAGLYEGSLKPDNPDYEATLNELSLVIMDDAVNSFHSDISGVSLHIISSDKVSQQKYIEEFSGTYEDFLEIFIRQMSSLEENLNNIGFRGFTDNGVVRNFRESSAGYRKVFDELERMNVPKGWEANHLGTIKLAKDLSLISEAVINGGEDPIKATIGLNNLLNLWEVLPRITEAYSTKIQKEGLNSEKTIFR